MAPSSATRIRGRLSGGLALCAAAAAAALSGASAAPAPAHLSSSDSVYELTALERGSGETGAGSRHRDPLSTFACSIDRRAYLPCRSPKTLKQLSRGRHRFSVYAMRTSESADPSPAVRSFKVGSGR